MLRRSSLITDRARRPSQFPPPFASVWGDDAFGLWAELKIASQSAAPIVQRMRWIEPGSFLMGSPESEPERYEDEGPQHLVHLSQGFWLADTACTRALWQAVMGSGPSNFTAAQRPVERVSWLDVQAFLRNLEALDPDYRMTLPTEAQWEYACRAGTVTAFSFGANITAEQVNYRGNVSYAKGAKGKYPEQTVVVKTLPPNPWGLYEMHGNVDEWCADGMREYMAEAMINPSGDLQDGSTLRAVRGGAWFRHARLARSAFRVRYEPGNRRDGLGFRLCSRSQ